MSTKDEILYAAYKSMLMKNADSGFLRQHIEDADYYAFDKYPDLFLEVIGFLRKKYNTDGMVQRFYELNPHRKEDKNLAKEIFKLLHNDKDFKALVAVFGEELFSQDIPLMKHAVKNVGGMLISDYYGFPSLRKNEELRESLYDLANFSLNWFDLPAPDNDELIREILGKNFCSFTSLNDCQKSNKEYVLLTLEKMLSYGSKNVTEIIYKEIPAELKVDKDIALLASKGNYLLQPKEAFFHEGVLKELLNSVTISTEAQRSKEINLGHIDQLNTDIFKKPENIQVFLEWLTENKEKIAPNHNNYGVFYKIMKDVAKINSYVKEQFKKKETEWHIGNLGETKHDSSTTFKLFFKNNVPKMCAEVKYYVLADQLSKKLDKNEISRPKVKI